MEFLKRVFGILKEEIRKYKMEFNSKIKIYTSYEEFSFLGINYYVKNNKLIKRISKRNKKKILCNINNINYKFYKNYIKYIS